VAVTFTIKVTCGQNVFAIKEFGKTITIKMKRNRKIFLTSFTVRRTTKATSSFDFGNLMSNVETMSS